MSRSHKKSPVTGGGKSAKIDKKIWNGIERARTKNYLRHEQWEMAENKHIKNCIRWEGAKDGQSWEGFRKKCYCHMLLNYKYCRTCVYCQYGGYDKWLKKAMRK